jgi:ribosome modulation factor
MEKEMNMNKELDMAYDEGFSSRYAGEEKSSNPYRELTQLAQSWNAGWRDADLDLGEEDYDVEEEDYEEDEEE